MAKGNQKKLRGKPLRHSLLEHYQPIDGVVDEMVDASGHPRPAWAPFIEALEELGPEKLGQRFARADQYLRDAGVYYRVYDKAGANEREWPLAHIPLLIEDKDSPYVNYLVGRPDNQNDPRVQMLAKALTSPEVKAYIEQQYHGAVLPAF
jgi:uncharacterized circularly permuted ATP-grasp superfamily protein